MSSPFGIHWNDTMIFYWHSTPHGSFGETPPRFVQPTNASRYLQNREPSEEPKETQLTHRDPGWASFCSQHEGGHQSLTSFTTKAMSTTSCCWEVTWLHLTLLWHVWIEQRMLLNGLSPATHTPQTVSATSAEGVFVCFYLFLHVPNAYMAFIVKPSCARIALTDDLTSTLTTNPTPLRTWRSDDLKPLYLITQNLQDALTLLLAFYSLFEEFFQRLLTTSYLICLVFQFFTLA